MRPHIPPSGILRACANATAGPSRIPPARPFQYPIKANQNPRRSTSTFPSSIKRHASTSSVTSSTGTGASSSNGPKSISAFPHPAFDQLSTSLSSWLPCFGARGDEVRLLTSPSGFYQDVLDMMKRAKRRILISTLYIGVEETELVSCSPPL